MTDTAPASGTETATRQLLPRHERQEVILQGAARAFARSGFAATSMEDVAAESGITKLIVYRHFDSKEELYRAVLARVSDRLTEEFVENLQRGARGVGVRALLAVARHDPDGFVLLWVHAAREPQFAAYAEELRERSLVAARLYLDGSPSDPTLHEWAAELLVGASVEAVLAWITHGDPARDEDMVTLTSRGLAAMRRSWR